MNEPATTVEHGLPVERQEPCPACQGTGKVVTSSCDEGYGIWEWKAYCGKCGGTGRFAIAAARILSGEATYALGPVGTGTALPR